MSPPSPVCLAMSMGPPSHGARGAPGPHPMGPVGPRACRPLGRHGRGPGPVGPESGGRPGPGLGGQCPPPKNNTASTSNSCDRRKSKTGEPEGLIEGSLNSVHLLADTRAVPYGASFFADGVADSAIRGSDDVLELTADVALFSRIFVLRSHLQYCFALLGSVIICDRWPCTASVVALTWVCLHDQAK